MRLYLVRRLGADTQTLPVTTEWLSELSTDRYLPMTRLLEAFRLRVPSGAGRLHSGNGQTAAPPRAQVFCGYLQLLESDFNRVAAALHLILAQSTLRSSRTGQRAAASPGDVCLPRNGSTHAPGALPNGVGRSGRRRADSPVRRNAPGVAHSGTPVPDGARLVRPAVCEPPPVRGSGSLISSFVPFQAERRSPSLRFGASRYHSGAHASPFRFSWPCRLAAAAWADPSSLVTGDPLACFNRIDGAATLPRSRSPACRFARALHVKTGAVAATANAWDIRPRCFTTLAARTERRGRRHLLDAHHRRARRPRTHQLRAGAQRFALHQVRHLYGAAGREWKKFEVPFTMAETYAANAYNFSFWVTFPNQEIEIGGISHSGLRPRRAVLPTRAHHLALRRTRRRRPVARRRRRAHRALPQGRSRRHRQRRQRQADPRRGGARQDEAPRLRLRHRGRRRHHPEARRRRPELPRRPEEAIQQGGHRERAEVAALRKLGHARRPITCCPGSPPTASPWCAATTSSGPGATTCPPTCRPC